jgi:membrane associated rhomboid family serine protease
MEKITEKWTFVRRNFRTKLVLSIICLVLCTWHVGFYPGCPWQNHILYSFFHVNGFHLAVNLLVLWQIRNDMKPVTSLTVATVASLLPMYVSQPTMGLSGFLFASFGLMWGRTGRWKEALKKAMPFIICTMAVPNVNGLLHFWCFVLGYIVAYCINNIKIR